MLEARFFTHGEDFDDKYELRDWLAGTLRKERNGWYRLKKASGLGDLERGSMVFFVKDDAIVGCGVVQKGIRPITKRDRNKYGWNDKEDMVFEKMIKFFPDSIWAFAERQFLDRRVAAKVAGKRGIGQGFPKIADKDILRIFARIPS